MIICHSCNDKNSWERIKICNNSIIKNYTFLGLLNESSNQFLDLGDHVCGWSSDIEYWNKIGNNAWIHFKCFIPWFIIIKNEARTGSRVTIPNSLYPLENRVKSKPQGSTIEERVIIVQTQRIN